MLRQESTPRPAAFPTCHRLCCDLMPMLALFVLFTQPLVSSSTTSICTGTHWPIPVTSPRQQFLCGSPWCILHPQSCFPGTMSNMHPPPWQYAALPDRVGPSYPAPAHHSACCWSSNVLLLIASVAATSRRGPGLFRGQVQNVQCYTRTPTQRTFQPQEAVQPQRNQTILQPDTPAQNVQCGPLPFRTATGPAHPG